MNRRVLEKKANDFRQVVGISSHASMQLKSILTKLNIITVFKPLGDGLSGMAIKLEASPNHYFRFILVNSNNSLGKQHFTICHELYHLYIQEDFQSRTCITGKFDKEDKEEFYADWFAAFLLLPEIGIKSLIPDNEIGRNKMSLNTILKIEHYFGSSRSALLVRLQQLKLISDDYAEQFKSSIKNNALLKGYLTNLYEEGNHNQYVGDYGALASDLYTEGKLSENQYHQLLKDLIGPHSRNLFSSPEKDTDELNN